MTFEKNRGQWWGRVIPGIIAVIVGLAFLFLPKITLVIFLWIFGVFMVVTGIILISHAWSRSPGSKYRKLNFIEGGFNIIIGAIAILAPGLTSLIAIYLVAAFAIISGILQILEGFFISPRERTLVGSSRGLLIVAGIWALLIGIILALFPAGGILALMWLIGIFLVVLGIINILWGMRVRKSMRA
ncbi:MAG: hypothetical protein GX369_01495 [Euryarchaeota archaeon]|nr:hypothetical protein [Euryarchaeota archaeon]